MTVSGLFLQSHPDASSHLIFGGYHPRAYRTCHTNGDCCYNPRCWRRQCRERYRWTKYKQIQLGVDEAQKQGLLLRLVTFTLLNPAWETFHMDVINGLKASVQLAHKKLMDSLKRRGHKPMWWRAWGMKQESYPHQLHVHQLLTCTPDSDPLANADLKKRIEKAAKDHCLCVHIEAVTDPIRIAGYLAYKNLGELDDIELPHRFQRFQASPNAPKMDWQIRRANRRKLKAQHKRLLQTFPILYCKHWRVWAERRIRQLLAQHVHRVPVLPMQRTPPAHMMVNQWFSMGIANLWGKIRYGLTWLTRKIASIAS